MTETSLLAPLMTTAPAQLLISGIWQGLLLTASTWACLTAASRLRISLRASARFTLWLSVFLLVALLPCLTLLRGYLLGGSLVRGSSVAFVLPSVQLDRGWAFALEGLWLLASLWSMLRVAAGIRQMSTLFRESSPVPYSALSIELQVLLRSPGSRPLGVRLSNAIEAPSVIGFFRPAVVMPASMWKELPAADLYAILVHEKAHLDRGDDWTNLLQKLLRALYPLNPALAWAERSLCREREQACDDAVLETAGDPRAYATCLTRLAETRLVKRAAALAPGLWKRHSELAARVQHILEPRPTTQVWLARGLMGVFLAIAGSTSILLQRCPGLVSFGSLPVVTANPTAPGRLPAANLVHASYAVTGAPAKSTTLSGAAGKPRPHVRLRYTAASVQYWQLRSDGERVTLTVFTLEVPRGLAAQPTGTKMTAYPLLFPDNWIESQI